jgi:hypothetical protein
MRHKKQVFPYVRGTSIFVRPETLNLLAQVKGPGETWTYCVERLVRAWAREHGIILVDKPTVETVMRARQTVAATPLGIEEVKGNGTGEQ